MPGGGLMEAVRHRLAGWRRDRRGNVAIITALLMIPLTGMAALAIDVGNAVSARASLDAAADSAALLATTVASNQYLAGMANPTAAAKTAAGQRFSAQAGSIDSVTLGTVSVGVTQSGAQFASTVTYTAGYQTALASVVGIDTITLRGVSASSLSVNPYVDIQVLMDVSASMLIAATPADITAMEALSSSYVPKPGDPGNVAGSCAFACHWNSSGPDFLSMAKAAGITLRLDVLRSAVSNLITNVASLNKQASFRLGLSTFNASFSQVYPTSSNIAGATAALNQIAPDTCGESCGETFFSNAMSSLNAVTPASGTGATQATSQKYLFIVTDGLVDQRNNGQLIAPISPSDCAALKAKGVTVLTLYTPYLPIMNNPFYVSNVWPYQSMGAPDDIQQAMSACASTPSLSYVASNSAQIDAQLQTMLAAVIQTSGHFTQ